MCRRLGALVVLLTLVASTAEAQHDRPAGWSDCSEGGNVYRDTAETVAGRHLLVLAAPEGHSIACVRQALNARPYRGLWVYLEGAVRGWSSHEGGIWVTTVRTNGEHQIAQMNEDSLQLSMVWTRFTAGLWVPEDADTLYVGASTFGEASSGALWVDDLYFYTRPGPWTRNSSPPPPPFPQPPRQRVDAPANLSFEQ